MDKDELKQEFIDKIDSKHNTLRELTQRAMESLCSITAVNEELNFLNYIYTEYLDKETEAQN